MTDDAPRRKVIATWTDQEGRPCEKVFFEDEEVVFENARRFMADLQAEEPHP